MHWGPWLDMIYLGSVWTCPKIWKFETDTKQKRIWTLEMILVLSPFKPNLLQMSWRTWRSSAWRSEPLVNWRLKATTGSIGQMPSNEPSSDSPSSFTAAMATLVCVKRRLKIQTEHIATRTSTPPNMQILRKFIFSHQIQLRSVSLRVVNHVARALDEIRTRKWLEALCKSYKMIASIKNSKSYMSQITLVTVAKLAAFDTRAQFQVQSEFGPPLMECSGTCHVAPSN